MPSLRHIERDRSVDNPLDAYLDAARACILDVGWRRTTLTEVARRAGVSRMTIYRSWADMPTLLGDLMTREWTGVVGDAVAGEDPDQPAVARLVDEILRTVRVLRDNELFLRIVELDPELLLPYLLSRRGRSQDLILRVLESAVRAGQESGDVRPGNPTAIARGLLLATHGFVLSAHTMLDDPDPSAGPSAGPGASGAHEDELDAELALILTRTLQP